MCTVNYPKEKKKKNIHFAPTIRPHRIHRKCRPLLLKMVVIFGAPRLQGCQNLGLVGGPIHPSSFHKFGVYPCIAFDLVAFKFGIHVNNFFKEEAYLSLA